MHKRLLGLILALLIFSAASCGGAAQRDTGSGPAPPVSADALHDALGGFALTVSRDSLVHGGSLGEVLLTRNLTADGVEIGVAVEDARDLKALYFELAYDAEHYSPQTAAATGELEAGAVEGSATEVLELAVLNDLGTVHHGQIVVHPALADGVSGDVTLATVTFAQAPADLSRIASAAPTTDFSRTSVEYVLDANTLSWRYACQGDYDQNSEVSISDLTPLAAHFDSSSGGGLFPLGSIEYQVDGDGNGEINISDITPIGGNLGRKVARYNVYASTDESDIPADNSAPSSLAPIGEVDFSAATGAPSAEALSFTFTPPTVDENLIYWVRPADDSSEGTPSRPDGNIVLLTPETTILGPETGIEFAAQLDDDTLQLTDPPGGTDVELGQVLVGVYEDIALSEFHGVMDRVIAIDSRVGDLVTVTTEPASFTDVFQQAGFKKTADMLNPKLLDLIPVRYPCAVSTTVKEAGHADEPQAADVPEDERYRTISADYARDWEQARLSARTTSADSDIELDFSGAKLFERTDGPNYLRVVVDEGTFEWNLPGIDVAYDVGVDWCWFVPCGVSLKYFKAGVSGGVASDLVVKAEGHWETTINEEAKLWELTNYYVFAIGPVPVVMRTTLSIFGGVKGQAHADLFAKAGYHMDYGLAMGVKYQHGAWDTFYDPTAYYAAEPPALNVSGSADLNAYLRGEVTIAFYDIAGGKVILTPSLDGHADGNVDLVAGEYCLNWYLDGRLKGELNLFAEILGFDIFNRTWTLFELDPYRITDGTIGCGSSSIPNVYFHGTPADILFGPPPVTMTFTAGDDSLEFDKDTFDPDSVSNNDPGIRQGIKQYYWDLDGDGSCEQMTPGDVGTVQHTYDAYGTYNASVWVVDDDGMIVKQTTPVAIIPPIE